MWRWRRFKRVRGFVRSPIRTLAMVRPAELVESRPSIAPCLPCLASLSLFSLLASAISFEFKETHHRRSVSRLLKGQLKDASHVGASADVSNAITMSAQVNYPLSIRPMASDQDQLPLERSKEDLETAESLLTHSQSGRHSARPSSDNLPTPAHVGDKYTLPPPPGSDLAGAATFKPRQNDPESGDLEPPHLAPISQIPSAPERSSPPADASVTGQVCV